MSKKQILSKSVISCPICRKASSTEELIYMPAYPLTELFTNTPPTQNNILATTLDQTFCYCSECYHGYLKEIISPEFLYSKENYNTVTTLSQGSLASINNFASFVSKNADSNSPYSIDIGGNDSNLLKKLGRSIGCIIDPNASSDAKEFECINQFVEEIDPERFDYDSVDILSSHTLEHIEDPHVFFKFISKIQNVSSVFIQVPCLELMISSSRYDLVHHQHLHYFTLSSIKIIATQYGFSVKNWEYDVGHYGTLRVHLVNLGSRDKAISHYEGDALCITPQTIATEYKSFALIASQQSLSLSKYPNLYCYGASLMLPIVFYYYPCLNEVCMGILDQEKKKSAIWYSNVAVPILHDDQTDLSTKSIVLSAVATRSACRKIVKNTIDRNPLHMFIPFGEF